MEHLQDNKEEEQLVKSYEQEDDKVTKGMGNFFYQITL